MSNVHRATNGNGDRERRRRPIRGAAILACAAVLAWTALPLETCGLTAIAQLLAASFLAAEAFAVLKGT
jgi:hypothetical protein